MVQVAGQLLSRVTWALLKLLVVAVSLCVINVLRSQSFTERKYWQYSTEWPLEWFLVGICSNEFSYSYVLYEYCTVSAVQFNHLSGNIVSLSSCLSRQTMLRYLLSFSLVCQCLAYNWRSRPFSSAVVPQNNGSHSRICNEVKLLLLLLACKAT